MGKDYDRALRAIAKGTSIAFIGGIASGALGFLSRVVTARYLTAEAYGLLSLALAVFSIAVMFSLMGVPEGLRRYISYYIGKKDLRRAKGTVVSSLLVTLPISCFLGVAIFVLADYISSFFQNQSLVSVLRIFAVGIPFWTIAKNMIEANVGYKKVEYKVLSELTHQVLRITMVWFLLIMGFGLIGACYGYLLAFLAAPIVGYYFLQKSMRYYACSGFVTVSAELMSFSWPLLLSSFSRMVLSWTDTMMLGYFKSENVVGIYNAAMPVAQLLFSLGTSFALIFLPVITELYSKGNAEDFRRIYRTTTKWAIFTTFPMFFLIIFFGKWAIYFSFGPKYVSGYQALLILSIGFLINSTFILSIKILSSLARTKTVMVISYLSAFLNVVLNYILIPELGIIGAAIATSTSLILQSFLAFYMSYRVTDTIPFSGKDILTILSAAVSVSVIYAVNHFVHIKLNVLYAVALLTIYMLTYVAVLVALKFFDYEEKMLIRAILKKIMTRRNLP